MKTPFSRLLTRVGYLPLQELAAEANAERTLPLVPGCLPERLVCIQLRKFIRRLEVALVWGPLE